jgi:flagellin-like hook-associated protein FlgL
MAQKGGENNTDADLQKAYDLVAQGLDGVISTQSVVNQNKVQIDTINTQHQSLKLYFKGVKDSIGNTDFVSVSTEVALNQGILQAAFQTFAKINSLRLSDYLK